MRFGCHGCERFQLLGKRLGIAREFERFDGQHRRGGVMAVRVRPVAVEKRVMTTSGETCG